MAQSQVSDVIIGPQYEWQLNFKYLAQFKDGTKLNYFLAPLCPAEFVAINNIIAYKILAPFLCFLFTTTCFTEIFVFTAKRLGWWESSVDENKKENNNFIFASYSKLCSLYYITSIVNEPSMCQLHDNSDLLNWDIWLMATS